MDSPGQAATTQSALQQVKAELKKWEREFQTQHSCPPSKADVQACASIQQMYREYARLKKKLGKENVQTEKKIHVNPDPKELVTKEVNDPKVFPLDRNRILPPHPASPSDDSSGSHISATPPKLVSTKAPSSGTRRPLQLLSPNNTNIPLAQSNPNQFPSTRKSESIGNLKRTAATKTAPSAPKKPALHPAEVLSSDTEAPRQNYPLPACSLALEGGLVIRLQRHGTHGNDRQSSLVDDPLPAGFFSRSGPSSLVRKDLETCSITPAEDVITGNDENDNLGPVTTAAPRGDSHMKSQGTFGESVHGPEFVFDQPQCADTPTGAQTSTLSSAAGIERLASLKFDDPSNFASNEKNDIRKTTSDLDDASVDMKDLQKLTVVGLKRMLLKQGLPLTGNKATLVRRLEDALSTEKQMGLPSIESTDLKSDEHKQVHKETTCGTRNKSLKRKLDNKGHEQLLEDACDTENSRSPRPARKCSLRSKGLPSTEQHETESGKVDAAAASVTMAPGLSSAGEGHKVSVVKSRTKRVKISDSLEENSWANPKVLRKGARRQTGRTPVRSKSRQRLSTRPGERDNFVRLNINGKGGRGRRFVNGTRTRRPGAYGRRGTHGAKFRKKGRMDASKGDFKCDDEGQQEGDCGPGKKYTGHRANSLWANDGWLETNASAEGLEDSNDNRTNEMNTDLKDAVEKAQKNPSEKSLIELLDLVFGFKTFRTGQLEAIERILSLQNTMVVLPTGAGKSLCYQLPAHLLPGVTLVISPLIALMTDQLAHLPPSLPGALISSAQTPQESSATIFRLRAGQVKVLFISPERLFSESFLCTLGELPTISLAVIDEAHCLSEWSHNFRPSYFRLGKILHQRMKVSCVVALTATATRKAEQSILKSLCIPDAGVVQASHVRQNLSLSVSRERNRLQSLLALLQSSPYAEAKSVIIYCTFQVETDNISGFLEKNGIQAKSYHAKKTSQERIRIYDLFCRNKLRVVVATVAFGMGLDKSDVRAIIHYNVPRSLEHYVQETGRAGRDGNPAYCHLFLDDGDFLKLRSLAYSDGVDEYSVNKFLCRVFDGCSSIKPGNLVSIIIDTASRELDMKEEVMETILSLLEVGEVEYLKVLSRINATCTLSFHQSNPASLAGRNTFVAAIMKRSKEKQGRFIFDLPTIATQLQWSLFQVQSELRRLQAAAEITYEVGDPSLCFTVLQTPMDICLLTSQITKRLAEVEQCQVRKLDAMYLAASAAVRTMNWAVPQESNVTISSQQASLQSYIKSYFEGEEDITISTNVPTCIQSSRSFVRADIKVFLKSARNPLMTGRAVARIFHGLWSPAFPYSDWAKSHFWGLHTGVDFEIIKDAAAGEILTQHTTNRDDFQL
ncbi:unnamed protein product [Calypogeia fissa]